MRFSSVFGWWMHAQGAAGVQVKSPVERSQPAQKRLKAATGGSSSSTSVKSEGLPAARKMAPEWNWVRVPSPAPPLAALPGVRQNEFWKFQKATMVAASPASTPQWLAVMKYILRSLAVLLRSDPEQVSMP